MEANKENSYERSKRIIREVMHVAGFDSVQDFVNALGVNYMMVYNPYCGKVSRLSDELITRINQEYPNISIQYLTTGDGDLDQKQQSQDGVSNTDIVNLLERVTTLLEKIQSRDEKLLAMMDRVITIEGNLMKKILSVDERSDDDEQN